MRRREQIIWAAGFFDGEGCISIAQHRPRKAGYKTTHALDIRVFQKGPEALMILQSLFGGSLVQRMHGKCWGWLWYAYASVAVSVLKELEPFLVVKKSQAQLGIAFQARKVRRGGKYANPVPVREQNVVDFLQMKSLKK